MCEFTQDSRKTSSLLANLLKKCRFR